MLLTWLVRVLVTAAVFAILALFRRMAPPRARMIGHRYDDTQIPPPLPTGLIGGAMWVLGLTLALLFFILRGANHLWASLEGPSILTQFVPQVLWCFFPGFAALSIPWPFTVWYLRKMGRWEEADGIEDAADSKGRMNSSRVMKWLTIVVVVPIALFTLPAIPIHLSISDSEVRIGHYASFTSERFPMRLARRLTMVDGYRQRDGTFHPAKDLIIDYADGRRLKANQVGDGGTNVRNDVMQLLIARTGLMPEHALTADNIAPLTTSR